MLQCISGNQEKVYTEEKAYSDVLSILLPCGPWNLKQSIRPGGDYLYQLSYLTNPALQLLIVCGFYQIVI